MGLVLEINIIHNPIVKGTVVGKLDRTHGMGNTLQSILNGMSEIVKRIYAPSISLSVVGHVTDTENSRVTHNKIGRSHIYLCTESLCAIGEFAVLHTLKQFQILLNASVTPRRFLARLGKGSAVCGHFICGEIAHIGFTLFYKLNCVFIAFSEIIAAVKYAARRLEAQPADIVINTVNVLYVFFSGVGIVITEVEFTVEILCGGSVYPYSLKRADMKITVGLRRKTGMDVVLSALRKVGAYNIV
jgi:hypothetical protein